MAAAKKKTTKKTTKKSVPTKSAVTGAKKKATKKTTAKKKTAAKKKATKKAPAKKKTPAKRVISSEERYQMIQTAAYFRAQQASFQGDPQSFWTEAEKEIDAMLSE